MALFGTKKGACWSKTIENTDQKEENQKDRHLIELSDDWKHYWVRIENVKMYIKEIFVVFCVISNILAAEIPQPSIANLASNTEEFHKLFVPCSSSEKSSRNTNDNISVIEKMTHSTGN